MDGLIKRFLRTEFCTGLSLFNFTQKADFITEVRLNDEACAKA
ncbi:hypothetical protein J500_2113 [Acinetobacter sp. 479375]|nr:hypothetical protein J500_2113 [Acinetobacter sp. 479375]